MKAPILDKMELIELAYQRLGHKIAKFHDITPEKMSMSLGEVLSSGFCGSDSFEKSMEVMNAESRKRFRPSERVGEIMNALQLDGGDSEHKGMDNPLEIPSDEFCIDLDRARQHFRHPCFFRENRGAPESKSPNDDGGLHHLHEYFQGLENVSDLDNAEYFTINNSTNTSITKSTSYSSLKSSEEGSISVSDSTSSSSGGVIGMKDKLVINDVTNRVSTEESLAITKSQILSEMEDSGSERSRSIVTRSRSRSCSDESHSTQGTFKKKRINV